MLRILILTPPPSSTSLKEVKNFLEPATPHEHVKINKPEAAKKLIQTWQLATTLTIQRL